MRLSVKHNVVFLPFNFGLLVKLDQISKNSWPNPTYIEDPIIICNDQKSDMSMVMGLYDTATSDLVE